MIMDHHSYRQQISEEPDRFETGLHHEDEEENSLHCRQIRVLNRIALLFGDSYNDYTGSSNNADYNDDNPGNNDDRSTPPWQQGDDDDIFSNGYISTRRLARSSSSSSVDRYRQHCDPTNNNSISGDKDESDLLVDPQVQGSFIIALPPSLLSPTAAILPSPPPDVTAVKRGPGRSRGVSKKQLPSPHPPDVIDTAKRGPGRPKKGSLSSRGRPPPPSSHPPDTDAVMVKRGPGRPKGSLSFKNRSTSISLIITPTVTTRARARTQSVRRVRPRVTDPSLASASSSSNVNATRD
ncbi:hypothetical protein EC957_010401 [Mortierella hygrophila]|uniref:Uncharacterized protein n=1 Tax=Mortierella hygrophila TaxID=979708 RepID=A0A9P6F957_9FUNG|nr:hypothetical protein EC957_010401 [Mortierella hygrophila]